MATKEELTKAIEELKDKKNVRFNRLKSICDKIFGAPRTTGSHHVYKTGLEGGGVNIQPKKGGRAKTYQLDQVVKVLEKILEDTEE